MHNATLAFLLIPTITGSHMLCRHSSHAMLLSSLGGSIKPLEFPLATGLAGYRFLLLLLLQMG